MIWHRLLAGWKSLVASNLGISVRKTGKNKTVGTWSSVCLGSVTESTCGECKRHPGRPDLNWVSAGQVGYFLGTTGPCPYVEVSATVSKCTKIAHRHSVRHRLAVLIAEQAPCASGFWLQGDRAFWDLESLKIAILVRSGLYLALVLIHLSLVNCLRSNRHP